MFKEKPLFGHGAKMFRIYCQKEENFVAINACTSHPHNFYAQMLAEAGIIGFLLLISIFSLHMLLISKKSILHISKKKIFINR